MTKIFLSSLTHPIGLEAFRIANQRRDVEIIAAATDVPRTGAVEIDGTTIRNIRWFKYDALVTTYRKFFRDVDVVIDFSTPEHFKVVMTLAVLYGKPLIVGTQGLSDSQIRGLKSFTSFIPIFWAPNFSLKVKAFTDDAIKWVGNHDVDHHAKHHILHEHCGSGSPMPTPIAREIRRKIREATGESVGIDHWHLFDKGEVLADLIFGDLHCRISGYHDLAGDVLEIAKLMATRPTMKDAFYDLDTLWPSLVAVP